jgi:hypothetical protein
MGKQVITLISLQEYEGAQETAEMTMMQMITVEYFHTPNSALSCLAWQSGL